MLFKGGEGGVVGVKIRENLHTYKHRKTKNTSEKRMRRKQETAEGARELKPLRRVNYGFCIYIHIHLHIHTYINIHKHT